MKVLVANIPLPTNRFLVDLNGALIELGIELIHSHEDYWNCEGDYDVVHLHFPEYLTMEIQDAYREGAISEEMIGEIEKRLKYWSSKSRIVITRHVLTPHSKTQSKEWERIYELYYSYANGVAHFDSPSVDEFEERYANTTFSQGKPVHSLIPHHNYCSLPNETNREESRRKLGIPMDRKVVLIFGAIRNDEETDLILNAFNGATTSNKFLLASRWRERLADVSWIRLKYWIRDAKRWYYRNSGKHRFNYGFVQEEDAQYYLHAADVLFIPRLKVLNSGNITLGMTFGKVIVGPDSLDVGSLLKSTGNPTFDPDKPDTAAAALDEAFKLTDADLGQKNQRLALDEWSPKQCAQMYIDLYESTIKAATTA
ncbi:MAG: hypothetical protein AAFX93_05385 [Verrucomicrobiota bacterium]